MGESFGLREVVNPTARRKRKRRGGGEEEKGNP